jgi:hypothetical protein
MIDSPTQLNAMLRLVLIAKNHGAYFLDDAESFDRLIGRGRFAELDGNALCHIKGLVKALRNCGPKSGIQRELAKDITDNVSDG